MTGDSPGLAGVVLVLVLVLVLVELRGHLGEHRNDAYEQISGRDRLSGIEIVAREF